jgi:DNA-binding beta-propeller fold protein YncE
MKGRAICALAVVVGAAFAASAAPGAAPEGHAVFVQTNEPTGNKIVVYDRAPDGSLTRAGTYATGGDGGVAVPGTESDHLASQGSLVYDPAHRLLFAVNGGSDSVSVFSVHGDRLERTALLASGGEFPASIAVHGRLVYVLNSGGSGILQGFRIAGDHLVRIPESTRS